MNRFVNIKMCLFHVWLLAVLCATVKSAPAQQPFMQQYWMNENYTPVPSYALLQDSFGYIWVGTAQGLFRFNGEHFTKITDTNRIPVTALAATFGKIWMGYKNGASATVSGRLQHIVPGSRQHSLRGGILQLIPDDSGDTLWAATGNGLAILYGDTGKILLNTRSGLSDTYIYSLCRLPGGCLLLGTDNGINDVSWNGTEPVVHTINTKDGLPDNIVQVIRQIPGQAKYWVGMQEGGVALYDAAGRAVINFSQKQWAYGPVNDILPMSESRAWIVTRSGYLIDAVLSENNTIRLHAYHYPNQQLNKIICDASGNLWCATKDGLSLFTAEYLSRLPLTSPYTLQELTAMAYDRDGNLWLAQNQNLYRVRNPLSDGVLQLEYRAEAPISCLYTDVLDRLWIGTVGKGLFLKDKGQGVPQKRREPEVLHSNNILSIAETPGRIWIATFMGVEELSFPRKASESMQLIRHHNKQSGIGSDYIYFLFPDRNNRLWMATDGAGICVVEKDRYRQWNPGNSAGRVVYTITEDASGNIWAGTYYNGLYRFPAGNGRQIKQETVTDANITTAAANATGQVVIVYDRCIDEWYPESRQFRHFNYRQQMDIDSTSGVLNCMAKDWEGNVFIPYEHGMLIFKNQQHTYDIRPGVRITDVQESLKSLPEHRHELAPSENYITISFEGISFTNPERIRLRYCLEGYDSKWIYTNDESVTFPSMPPGNYVFRVQAALSGDFDLAREDVYTFSIATPVWKQTWFLLLSGLATLTMIYLIIRQRDKRQQELALLQQERMSFEYEHLKSQVNPHFLFNSLNTLSNLIEEDPDTALFYTEQLSDLYRNILSYRKKDLITLREELQILSAYLFIQQNRFGEAIQIDFNIPDNIPDSRKIVPMALQMLLENAIKHNVVSVTQPLKIKIWSDKDIITVSNIMQPKMSKEAGAGLALANIQRRYSLLPGGAMTYGVSDGEFVVTLTLF